MRKWQRSLLVRGKRAANMTKNLGRRASRCLKMCLQVSKEKVECAAMVIMCHNAPRDTPEPFNAVGVRIIGRGIDQAQMLFQFDKHAAHEQGASRCMGSEIVHNDDGDTSALLGASYSGAYLLAEHISSASQGHTAIEPAITPVQ